MSEEFQPATCVLCNNPGESRETIGVREKEYRCSQGHHYIIKNKAEKLLAGVGMAQSRQRCIDGLKVVPHGQILFIRMASSEEKTLNPSLTLQAEYRIYQE